MSPCASEGRPRDVRGSIQTADLPATERHCALLREIEQRLGIDDGPEDGGVKYA